MQPLLTSSARVILRRLGDALTPISHQQKTCINQEQNITKLFSHAWMTSCGWSAGRLGDTGANCAKACAHLSLMPNMPLCPRPDCKSSLGYQDFYHGVLTQGIRMPRGDSHEQLERRKRHMRTALQIATLVQPECILGTGCCCRCCWCGWCNCDSVGAKFPVHSISHV